MTATKTLEEKFTHEAEVALDKVTAQVTEIEQRHNEEVAPLIKRRDEAQELLQRLSGKAPSSPNGRRRSGRRKGQPTRAEEFVAVIKENPGLSVSEISRIMGMKDPNYLYRVVEQVVKEGRVRKEGRKLFVTESS